MATMKQVPETETTGTVRKIYDEMIAHWGNVPNAYKVLANNPHVLKAAWEHRQEIMGHGNLASSVPEVERVKDHSGRIDRARACVRPVARS